MPDLTLPSATAPLPHSKTSPVVNSYNEWDPLKEVIVGRVDGAAVPPIEAAVGANTYPEHLWFYEKHGGKTFPPEMIEGAAKELDEFCRVLEGEGVTVRRPDSQEYTQGFQTPDFSSTSGLYGAMPRDILIVFGDEILEAPMAWRSRFFEYRAYRSLMKEYLMRGARWSTAPKPLMSDELYDLNYPDQSIEERKRMAHDEHRFVTTEFEPCFDAADIFRCGRDIFVQRSHVTNEIGIAWLRRHLQGRFRVHQVKCKDFNPMHIDASMVPLRPGLMLVNPERPCYQIDLFRKAGWHIVEAPFPTVPEDWPLYMASRWLSVNLLVLDPHRVILEKHEEPLHRLFRSLGFKVIPVSFRNVYPFGGSFHCVTCDVRRDGQLEEYGFDDPQEQAF